MISPSDLRARNALFAHGTALGLNWTSGEAADGRPTIYLPVRDPSVMRATLYPFAANWILRWTTPLHESATITVDKLGRDLDAVLAAVAAGIRLVIDATVEQEPHSALGLIGFLGALGIATADDAALAAATTARQRAQAVLAASAGPSA